MPAATAEENDLSFVIPTSSSGGSGSSSSGTRSGSGSAAAPATPTDIGPATKGEPQLTTLPVADAAKAETDRSSYARGDTVTVTATGFTAGENVQMVLYPGPLKLSDATADADGSFTATFVLADDALLGSHNVQLLGWTSEYAAQASFLVTSATVIQNLSRSALFWWLIILGSLLAISGVVFLGIRRGWFARPLAPGSAL